MDKCSSVVFYTHLTLSVEFPKRLSDLLRNLLIYRRKANGDWADLGSINIYITEFVLKKCTLQTILS